MKLLGEVVEILPKRLFIPEENRVAPSLKTNTELHGFLFPRGNNTHPDLFLSPFPRDSWRDIWRLELEFHDRPGIMWELTKVLGDNGVNILSHEIMTLGHGPATVGYIHLICDMKNYGGGADYPDGSSKRRQNNPDANLNYLIDCLTVRFWNSKTHNPKGDVRFKAHRPQFFATRLRELKNISHLAEDLVEDGTLDMVEGIQVKVKDGVIVLSDHHWSRFIEDAEPNAAGKYTLTVVSDTVERYVKITPLTRKRAFLPLDIRHKDMPGQVADFTALLRKPNVNGNIFCSYYRLEQAHGPAVWRCLLEVDSTNVEKMKDELTKEIKLLKNQKGDEYMGITFPLPLGESLPEVLPIAEDVVQPVAKKEPWWRSWLSWFGL